jgi:hypothetical protein
MSGCLGGYFMTEEDVRGAQGRLLLEHAETQKKLNLMKSEASRLAKVFRATADLLERHPSELFFSGESVSIAYGNIERQNATAFDVTKLKQLAEEIRHLESEFKRLSGEKTGAGF